MDPTDIRNAPAPSYVVTSEDRERWELAGKIAEQLWEQNSDDRLDPGFYWTMTRTIYASEHPTGSPSDVPGVPLSEGEEAPPNPARDDLLVRAQEMWQDVVARKPGDGASEADYWAHIGRIADVFDMAFGNPDDMDLGEYEGAMVADPKVEEALVNPSSLAGHLPYSADLHPRDRMGKWSAKFGAVHAAAFDRKPAVVRSTAAAVAAGRLHHDVDRTHVPNPDADEKAGFSGAAERLRAGMGRVHAAAIGSLGLALMALHEREQHHEATSKTKFQHAAHEALPVHRLHRDSDALNDSVDRVSHASHLATQVGHWAMQHDQEIRTVGHGVAAAARATGLFGGEVTVEDEADARAMLESLAE